MNGYLMAFRSDGTPIPLGKVTEINTITESQKPEPPLVHIAEDTEFTAKVALTKKDKKVWAKILNMPKFALTEWTFPRKKKRGTKRRIRKAYFVRELAAQAEVGKAIFGGGVLLSRKAAAEKAAAEKEATERAAEEKADVTRWELSQGEIEIIERLSKGGH